MFNHKFFCSFLIIDMNSSDIERFVVQATFGVLVAGSSALASWIAYRAAGRCCPCLLVRLQKFRQNPYQVDEEAV